MNIKVGEYVRTYDGKIDKVINSDFYMRIYIECKKGLITREYITKHSFDIIDLIEVGDYVNEHLVVIKNNDKIATEVFGTNGAILYWDKEKDIKTIVTREQFKKVEYEV